MRTTQHTPGRMVRGVRLAYLTCTVYDEDHTTHTRSHGTRCTLGISYLYSLWRGPHNTHQVAWYALYAWHILPVQSMMRTTLHTPGRMEQAWGQSTRYFGTLVLESRFCSTRRYSVLILLKSTCTRTCTQVLLKIKVLLTSTYGYFTSTSHLKLIQNSSQTNPKSLLQDMEHLVNGFFTIRLAIILKKYLINTLQLFQN